MAASLASAPTCSALASFPTRRSSDLITCSGAADNDYTISYVAGTLMVNPVALTITAVDKSKDYGATVRAHVSTHVTYMNGVASSTRTTTPTCSTLATARSHAGSYVIT